jgi:hypothetical protein
MDLALILSISSFRSFAIMVAHDTPNVYLLDILIIVYNFLSQQHILGFVTSFYNYILIRKNICD